ncbi:DUF3298 and DUF4163 domain-containing protein [Paenibacillus sp. GCM10012307]|uniref:DUF3298 and DUF4163 domain-containing protein n=1 Tax=Paenibacillus roseus TaxID=2798579 RepID=A0A934J2Q5_9BACL|nr:DUF3298 and DUF4163 domain-containing protein [Paenibacillus roseus]MBJ6363691.1 DUF3298 and DUF4163 domain-containing protein [Paenibacillus roseus]
MAFTFATPAVIQPTRLTYPKIELWIPVVQGVSDRQVQNTINEAIRAEAHKLIKSQGSLDDPRAEMFGWFEVKTNEKNVLSLSLYNYAYTGGAHGLTLQFSLTFDLKTGKQYTLSELFKPGSDYKKRLDSIIAAQIKARGIELLQPFEGIRPDQDFYIADRSLVIYFQLYEITAYVYGFQYFPISVYELQDIVNEQGPLGVMLVNN